MKPSDNIALIGMPGVGKSTVGVLLAKATGRGFVDTDVLIQAREGRTLQQIIAAAGMPAFLLLEEGHITSLELTAHVIATGGSAVYSAAAMAHLAAGGVIVYLHLPCELLERRIANLATRGVVIAPGHTFRDLYDQRAGLYRRRADLTVDCQDKNQDEITSEIVRRLGT